MCAGFFAPSRLRLRSRERKAPPKTHDLVLVAIESGNPRIGQKVCSHSWSLII